MKRILVISSSFRKGGNSDILADEFIRGAKESRNETEKIYLCDNDINYCRGCLACQSTYKCVIKDDASAIAENMKNADAIVFATPVYYYGLSGQLKTMLDRANPLFPTDYNFRDIYLLATAAEDEENTFDTTIAGIMGWIECFEKSRLAGTVKGGGVNDKGEIKDKTEILKAAYEMGKSVK